MQYISVEDFLVKYDSSRTHFLKQLAIRCIMDFQALRGPLQLAAKLTTDVSCANESSDAVHENFLSEPWTSASNCERNIYYAERTWDEACNTRFIEAIKDKNEWGSRTLYGHHWLPGFHSNPHLCARVGRSYLNGWIRWGMKVMMIIVWIPATTFVVLRLFFAPRKSAHLSREGTYLKKSWKKTYMYSYVRALVLQLYKTTPCVQKAPFHLDR